MLNLSKKILVAIDGSPQSDKAAEEAVRLAVASGTRFRSKIYAIIVLPGTRAPSFTDFMPSPPPTERPGWEEQRKRIFYVVEKVAAETGVALENVVVYGDAAEEILAFAEQEEISVIVIGSSGAGRVKRALLGSVSTKVALHARCSVYIVR
ncbi:Nucleotide-binding universal stress protein, UspA family [Geoalkalibacter ferrihydriticus]|uniref:Universal stress protein n=2 Tax=Geoalkalibacter ferrihydriticus TaxID=392333 RepID=A0A0C2HGY9_9BACT|nr:universal stress protein [Geoalkalibacter ferrihydriticus]KIH76231.1 universal stress protein [Geoalkalibacter ferrihydriticus DSM 17813]SDL25774.1 Nucleotide-binding universal stress protein, UspA family [Geoalkalibacter ferrihydriticus]